MPVIKPFMSGPSQIVRIPEEYRLPDEDIFVNCIGSTLMLTPKSKLPESFRQGLEMFTNDFMNDGRLEETESKRIDL